MFRWARANELWFRNGGAALLVDMSLEATSCDVEQVMNGGWGWGAVGVWEKGK